MPGAILGMQLQTRKTWSLLSLCLRCSGGKIDSEREHVSEGEKAKRSWDRGLGLCPPVRWSGKACRGGNMVAETGATGRHQCTETWREGSRKRGHHTIDGWPINQQV